MTPPTARTASELVNVFFMQIETPSGNVSCTGGRRRRYLRDSPKVTVCPLGELLNLGLVKRKPRPSSEHGL
jgi:hypothetical protein